MNLNSFSLHALLLKASLVVAAMALFSSSIVKAHNLDTTATSISFASDYVNEMAARASSSQALVQSGDEFWILIKTTPGPGTKTGVGGYQTFYVPEGVVVIDAAYVYPDPSDPRGFRNIPMKGQSPIAIGNGPIGAASTPELIGWSLPGTNGLGFSTAPVTATGVDRGTLAGVYADTGIFFSTDPRTAFNSYGMLQPPLTGPPAPMKNNSGDTVGEWFAANITNSQQRNILGVMTLWDSYQLRAYGRADVAPLIDNNGRGNAPWGLANVVAGPQSGYAWEFDFDAYQSTSGTAAEKMRAAIKIGPWNRVKYPGSQISSDQPGLISSILGQAGVDASLMGIEPTDIPEDTTAVRFAIGQLELGRPEFSAVKVRVSQTSGEGDCTIMHADAFGGDAGGTDGGKDHIWRYFDPTVVSLNPCVFLQKVASKSLVAPGETFYFDITFANNGSVELPNMTITDTLPSGLVHVSAIPAPTTLASPNFTWNLGTVQPGQLVTIRQYVRATGSGTLFNSATARSSGNIIGVAQQSVEVGSRAILDKSKTVTPEAVAPGETVTYTLTIENIGTGLNGVPLRVREFLPAGFSFVSLQGATLNGATISSPTITTNATNPAQPLFTIGQGIQPGRKLVITFNALVGANVSPGSYYNSYQLEYEGKVVPPIPEAPVTVAGGKIGDTVWRDWNGNGIQDPGEAGISGVTVQLYAADGTTLLRTTTTDSNGNYYFPGLVDGTYVVKVIPPANTIQTGDPDGTIDNQHTVTLATDQQYLTADFGYRPTGTASIGDRVFEDVANNGVFNAGTDTGIPGVTVLLYADTNNDGIFTPGVDVQIGATTTDGNGIYSFTGLAAGFNYLAVVDPAQSALTSYFGVNPYQASTPNPQPVTNLTGSYLLADFGFWKVEPGSIGDTVFSDVNGNGVYNPGTDSPLGGVTVNLLLDGAPFATTTTAPDGTYLFSNLGPGNYTVVVNATSSGVPSGFAPTVGQYSVNLTAGQNFLTADFPFTPLIAKSVDKPYAVQGDTLNFGVNVNYTGNALLSDVTVRDFLPAGTSFSSAQQGGQLVTFSSAPGLPGMNTFGGATVRRVYAFQGGTNAFWRYNATANSWTTLANVPGVTTTGSALTSDGFRYIYAFQGGSRAFYRYDAVLGTWNAAAVADLPASASVQGIGASLVYVDGFIYAFPGNSTNQFWRYSVSANTWTQINNAPGLVGAGGALATDGSDIYALQGGTQVTWRYNVLAGTWSGALANVGQNIGAGAGFVYAEDGFFYATTAGGNNRIYRYDPEAGALGTWTQGTNAGSPNTGGDLAYDGTNFYMSLGNNTATFVRRSFNAADVALAPAPGLVNAGGGLLFLESPDGILDSSITVSPSVVAVGTPVTVTMTVQATQAVTNVVPSALTVSGASATVSGPNVASRNLSANTPATFTWTVTPTASGIFTFSASASGSGGVSFAVATSNSLLASPEGSTQFVEWNLGGNVPGIPGTTSSANYLYGLRGTNTPAFWAYQVPQTAPGTWNSPLNPTDVTGFNINGGGSLAGDRNRYIYALQGGGLRTFLRYDTVSASWSDVAVADLPAEAAVVNAGGSMLFLNGFVYAFPGGGSNQFWRFNVATGTWEQRSNALATVLSGASLTTDGTFIYGTRGGATQTFWRYTPATDTWEARANSGRNFEPGSAIRHLNGFIYAITGKDKRLYRYNIALNTWSRLVDGPANFKIGAALVTDGTNLYAFRGDNQTAFYRYNVEANNWTVLAAAPATVGGTGGGALAFQPTGNVTQTVATSSRSMIGGVSQLLVRMTVTSDNAINNITPNAPTFTATGGASATFGSATLISADNNISGTGDPVIYEWVATVTPGSTVGSITFTTSSSVGGTAHTRSVIVTPTLTYSALVGANPPSVIRNTALVNETGGVLANVPSNTTETATSGSIGNFVWADLDGDGIQDAGEFGLAGVTVKLFAADGVTLLATDVTDSSGNYRFFGLAPANYVVSYDVSSAPAGYVGTTSLTVPVTLSAGQQFNDADFGLTLPPAGTGSIGDFVWLDRNNNGIQDDGEPGIPGVNVILERFINGNWVQVATTTTSATGAYNFTGLSAGDYRVTIDTQSQITSPYAQGTFALGSVMAPTFDSDGTGTPHVTLVTLATDSTVVTNADFGYNWSGSIGNFVWWDYNTDGLQNESPLVGIPNARVQLYFDADFDGVFDLILGDFEILRVFTDANGNYIIPNLPPGNYFVDVYEDSMVTDGIRNIVPTTDDIIPVVLGPGNMTVENADFGYFVGARVEATVFWDANGNAILDGGEQRLSGITVTLTGTDNLGNPVNRTTVSNASGDVVFLVPEGNYTISYTTADITANYPALGTPTTPLSFEFTAEAGEDGVRNFQFGVDNTGAIGDTIFADIDGNGIQSGSEPGLAGVTVNLYFDANGDGIIDFGAGDLLIETTLTDALGRYNFTGLADTVGAARYVVEVLTSTVPAAYLTVPTAFPSGADTATSRYSTALTGGEVINTVDFGYPLVPDTYYSVSGNIYNDNGIGGGTASNGIRDGGEPGITGVRILVEVDADDNGIYEASYVIFTDADGNYSLGGLLEGANVRLTVDTSTLPSNAFVQTGDPDGGTLSNVWTITDIQANAANLNFGYFENLGSITGTIVQGNGNGIAESGEPAIDGVTVTLTWFGPDGIPGTDDDVSYTTITDGNGFYEFNGLFPGGYEITTSIPAGYHAYADADGFNPNSINLNLALGQDVTGRDFEYQSGSISGTLWTDSNGDGTRDSGEPLLANVTVFLDLNGNGQLDTGEPFTITGVDGFYEFADLDSGTYQVRVDPATLPAGSLPSFDVDGVSSANVAVVSLAPNQELTTIDFGYYQNGSISGTILADTTANGIGDTALQGVTLSLLHGNGDPVLDGNDEPITTVTDENGNYSFANLPPGDYQVAQTVPTGYVAIGDADGGDFTVIGNITPITVSSGQNITAQDFVNTQPGAISGFLYVDANGDGTKAANELPIPGVRVFIDLNDDGEWQANEPFSITDAAGFYSISDLLPGDNLVRIDASTLPAGVTQTGDPDSEMDGKSLVALPVGQTVSDLNFGYQGNASIGDYVWNDMNGDGVQDATEPPLANVRVFIDLNNNGEHDADEPFAITDSSGYYILAGLIPGTYEVTVDTTTLPAGATQTGDPDGVVMDGKTTVVLNAGDQVTTADFGYQGNSSIGNYVWNDMDGDGVQQSTEFPIANVRIFLDLNNNGVLDADEPFQDTDASGFYVFTGLLPGNYTVVVDTSTLPFGVTQTGDPDSTLDNQTVVVLEASESHTSANFGYQGSLSIGNFIWNDLNGDGVQDGGEPGIAGIGVFLDRNNDGIRDADEPLAYTDANGAYLISGLIPGTYRVTIDPLSVPTGLTLTGDPDSELDGWTSVTLVDASFLDADFGYQGDGVLAGRVWIDFNDDGVIDLAELLLSGITVNLYESDGTTFVGTTDTNALGVYSFSGLQAGTYVVRVDTGSLPTGVTQVFDRDGDGNGLATPHEITFTIAANDVISDLDFGYLGSASVGNFVWNDMNGDGLQDATEPGVAGVRMFLDLDNDGVWDVTEPSVVTNADGFYQFTNLPPGTYVVAIDGNSYPEGSVLTADRDGIGASNGGTDGRTSVVLAHNDNITDADFGFLGNSSIGNYVWYDVNGDGVQDAGEPAIAGVRLFLDLNNNGELDADEPRVITDSSGFYEFTGLLPGTYQVRVDASTLPAGLVQSYDQDGLGTPNLTTVELLSTTARTDIDFGYTADTATTVSGRLYIDTNGNGTQDSGEPGLANVNVTITDSLGGVQTVVTDSEGNWSAVVAPGSVSVKIDESDPDYPTGYTQTEGTDPTIVTAVIEENTSAGNDGFFLPGSITGTIVQGDGNGVADAGETVIEGVTVTLTFAGPDGIIGTADDETFTTATNAAGSYEFTGLAPGIYEITTSIPSGYHAYADADGSAPNLIGVDLAFGENVTGRDFEYQSGSLSGILWKDRNEDGIRDIDESPITGATVFLDLNENGELDDGEPFTTTDGDGFYEFLGLNSGTYHVRVDPTSLLVGSLPSYDLDGVNTPNLAVVELTPNQNLEEVDFGYYTEAPVAINDQDLGNTPGDSVTINVLANDDPADGRTLDPTTVEIDGADSGSGGRIRTVTGEGVWTVNATTGEITFTPESGFTLDPTPIQYTVADDQGKVSNLATVTVDYIPVASDDESLGNAIGQPVTLDVLANDINGDTVDPTTVQIVDADVDSDGLTKTVDGQGTWTVNTTTGAITFTPEPGFSGNPTPISYTVQDNEGNTSNAALVTVTYTAPPLASNDAGLGVPGDPVTINAPFNDEAATGRTLDLTSVEIDGADLDSNGKTLTVPGEGVWTVNATTGEITFTPEVGFTLDPAPILYTILDDQGNASNLATVTVDYLPVASDDESLGNPVGQPVTVNVVANDNTGDTVDPTTVQILGADESSDGLTKTVDGEGTWTVNATTGAITFTPESGFTLDPTPIQYFINDFQGNLSNLATVTVDYIPVASDDESLGNPIGQPVTVDVLANDTNGDAVDPTTVQIVNSDEGSNGLTKTVSGQGVWTVNTGTGEITFTPEPGFFGDPTPISYTVQDGEGNTSNPALVTVTYLDAGSIGDFVWVDANGNGIQDPGEEGLSGVTVNLLDTDNNVVATIVTGSNGAYTFANLAAGTYRVQFVLPPGYVFTTQNADGEGIDGEVNSDADRATGITEDIVLNPGQVLMNVDAGVYMQECPDLWTDWQDKWDEELNGETGLFDNPDGDRYNNLIEYAFCLPPHLGIMKPFCLAPSTSVSGAIDGVYRRTAIGGAKDVTYVLEWTAELGVPTTWTGNAILDGNNTTFTDNGDGTETVRIPDLETLTGLTGTGFVRIRVDLLDHQDQIIATSHTDVLGWVQTDFGICCATYNNPLLECAVFTGTVDSINGQDLILTTSAGGFDLSEVLEPGVAYYIEVETGDLAGHRFDIASPGEGVLTLPTDSNIFSLTAPFNTIEGSAPSQLVASRIAVHRAKTLDMLFPPSGFGASNDRPTSDEVQVYANGQWKIYWLFDDAGTPRWVDAADGDHLDQGATVIPPGRGKFFNNRTAATSLLAYGEVREHAFANPLAPGNNLVGGGYPVDQTPVGAHSRDLNLADGFFGSRDFKTADSIFRWVADENPALTGYDTFFLLSNTSPFVLKWVRQDDTTRASQDGEYVFERDRSVFQRVRDGVSGYRIPAPWTP